MAIEYVKLYKQEEKSLVVFMQLPEKIP